MRPIFFKNGKPKLLLQAVKNSAWYFKNYGAGVTMRNRGFYLNIRIGCALQNPPTWNSRHTWYHVLSPICFGAGAYSTLRTRSLRVPKLRRRQLSPVVSSRVYLSQDNLNFVRSLKVRQMYMRINVIRNIKSLPRSYINMYITCVCIYCVTCTSHSGWYLNRSIRPFTRYRMSSTLYRSESFVS